MFGKLQQDDFRLRQLPAIKLQHGNFAKLVDFGAPSRLASLTPDVVDDGLVSRQACDGKGQSHLYELPDSSAQ